MSDQSGETKTSEKGPFEAVLRTSWLDVVAILLIAAACPVVYLVHKVRKVAVETAIESGGDR